MSGDFEAKAKAWAKTNHLLVKFIGICILAFAIFGLYKAITG
jgi:hypothetical protein